MANTLQLSETEGYLQAPTRFDWASADGLPR
jgi:hypothetical protein